MSARRQALLGPVVLPELALALVSGSLVYLTTRLFTGTDFVLPLLAVAAWAHVVAAAFRRRGASIALSLLVTLVGFALLTTWWWFPDTTVLGFLPGADTLDAVRASLDQGLATVERDTAPVAASDGLYLLAGAVLTLCVAAADWCAFRMAAPIEALLPSVAAFVLVVAFSNQTEDLAPVVAYAAACVAFLLAEHLAGVWTAPGLHHHARGGVGQLARVGAVAAVAAVALGVVVGPLLPRADEPLLDLTGTSDPNRVVISPLVQISERLVGQSDVVAFTVVSPAPANWRLTSLDTFDGNIWSSGGRYDAASGSLPRDGTGGVSADPLEQEVTIHALDSVWLPAAFRPAAVDPGDHRVSYQQSSATLIVDEDQGGAHGEDAPFAYRVLSEVPKPTAEQLDRPAAPLPDDIRTMLELPESFSPTVADLAQAILERAEATTPYEQALALQAYFRDTGVFADDGKSFTYVLGTSSAGHSATAMEDFLRSGAGYCEQFAGTYAAMARSVGLPARVAVGFSWGDQDPNDPTLYHVRGRHAHAWPEVWLGDDVGWIAFEPTPGRGAPGMEAYAGIEAAQAAPTAGTPDDPSDGAAHEPAPTVPEDLPPSTPEELLPSDSLEPDDALELSTEAPPLRWPGQVLWALLVVLGAAVTYVAVVLGLRLALRRAERAAAAGDPARQVRLAWRHAEEQLAAAGTARSPQETHAEYARRAATEVPEQAGPLAVLARAVEEASYAPGTVTPGVADRAERAAAELAHGTQPRGPLHRRIRRQLDPRPLWRRSVTRRG